MFSPAQHKYSHVLLETKKNWQAFGREIQKTFDDRKSQTQAQ